jgi:hypothetical protein
MKQLNAARDLLLDPKRRAEYDERMRVEMEKAKWRARRDAYVPSTDFYPPRRRRRRWNWFTTLLAMGWLSLICFCAVASLITPASPSPPRPAVYLAAAAGLDYSSCGFCARPVSSRSWWPSSVTGKADMRVALNGWFLVHNAHTGTGQYLRALCAWLPRVAPQHEYYAVVPAGRIAETPSAVRLHPVPCGASDFDKVRFEQILFPRACRALNADVAHVPHWAPPLASPAPIVATVHDLIPLLTRTLPEYRGGLRVHLYTALVAAATAARLVLADSEASRQDILQYLHLPPEKVRTVYLAAGEQYTPKGDWQVDEPIRQKYQLAPEGGYVLYLGGFDARKNVRALLSAWTWADSSIKSPLVSAANCRVDPNLRAAGAVASRRRLFATSAPRLWISGHVKASAWWTSGDKPAPFIAVAFCIPRYDGTCRRWRMGAAFRGSPPTPLRPVWWDKPAVSSPTTARIRRHHTCVNEQVVAAETGARGRASQAVAARPCSVAKPHDDLPLTTCILGFGFGDLVLGFLPALYTLTFPGLPPTRRTPLWARCWAWRTLRASRCIPC